MVDVKDLRPRAGVRAQRGYTGAPGFDIRPSGLRTSQGRSGARLFGTLTGNLEQFAQRDTAVLGLGVTARNAGIEV